MVSNLNFTQNPNNGLWEAEAKVEGKYTLHIERATSGIISIAQKSVESGNYGAFTNVCPSGSYKDFDMDFVHGNISAECPKWIKITSNKEVTSGKLITE